jgi:hypothetical protein
MSAQVALEHRTTYEYSEPVELGPHVVRLRPAPHCRAPIEAYCGVAHAWAPAGRGRAAFDRAQHGQPEHGQGKTLYPFVIAPPVLEKLVLVASLADPS